MDKYVIGMDGGGTKTEAVLVDFGGTVINRLVGGSTNYQALGGEKLKLEIMNLIQGLLTEKNVSTNKVEKIFLGLAGAGRKNDQVAIKALFDDTEYQDKIIVDSDAIIALAGAFSNQPGIILISGTGSICFGVDDKNNIIRSGGWGYLLGDEGSGFFIGHQAILAALKDFDGRGDKTSLRQIIEKRYHLSAIDQIIPLIYQNKIDRIAIADLAPVVFEQAEAGDRIAQQIIKQAGMELGKLAKAVALRLGFTDEKVKVALIGSIFKQRDSLINEISKQLFEVSWNVEIKDPDHSPAIGAAILALKNSGVTIDDDLLFNLNKSAKND